jgi:glycosyltransferase involved in cell wall biosynthesis
MDTFGGGERRTCLMACHFAQENDVTLFIRKPIDAHFFSQNFGMDMSRVRIVALGDTDHEQEIARFNPDIFINNTFCDALRCPAPAGIYMCMFPATPSIDLSSYDVITANSAFTAEWIRKRWGYDAEVVYSACSSMGPPSAKEKLVLNVGRFFHDGPMRHHKQQEILVDAFSKMEDEIAQGWQLHLIGNVGPESADRKFLDGLLQKSRNYPIRVSTGLDIHALRDEYRKAAIYWHATGYGVAENEYPEKHEHFGMTVIEAMSAGAVPIVIDGGGPRTTVRSGVNGFTWRETDELIARTTELIRSPRRLRLMARRAVRDSKQFNAEEFLARMDLIVRELKSRRQS